MRVPMSCRSIDQRVDASQHGLGRFARVTVQGVERHAAGRPTGARRVELGVRRLDHVVLHVRSESVLRPEQAATSTPGVANATSTM